MGYLQVYALIHVFIKPQSLRLQSEIVISPPSPPFYYEIMISLFHTTTPFPPVQLSILLCLE